VGRPGPAHRGAAGRALRRGAARAGRPHGAAHGRALGAGLAANQVGVLSRLLVYRVAPEAPLRVLVNPEIEWTAGDEELFAEGCLSLPGVWIEVLRPARVRVRACDEHGRPLTVEAEGREASVVQHEIDHLDGVLVLDRLAPEERRQAVRRLREAIAGDGR
jgi:peptide deformylase